MKIIKLLILSFFALGMIINSAFAGGKLVIASNASDAAPRQAMEDIVAKFQAANPDIEVVLNTTEHEAFKTAIRTILAADKGPDVATWFAGNRMAGFVSDGRIGNSHLDVPGHDGSYGFGGKCFPKDLNAFIHLFEEIGIDPLVIKAACEKNLEVRSNLDWTEIKGSVSEGEANG